MPAENRDVRGNAIYPAEVAVSDKFTDPAGNEYTGSLEKPVGASRISQDTTAQTVSSATTTKIQFDTVDWEDSNLLSADLTNNRLIAEKDGVYSFSAMIEWAGATGWSNGDEIHTRIITPSPTQALAVGMKVGTGKQSGPPASHIIRLTAGQAISLNTYQNSGAGKDTIATSQYCHLSGAYIGE